MRYHKLIEKVSSTSVRKRGVIMLFFTLRLGRKKKLLSASSIWVHRRRPLVQHFIMDLCYSPSEEIREVVIHIGKTRKLPVYQSHFKLRPHLTQHPRCAHDNSRPPAGWQQSNKEWRAPDSRGEPRYWYRTFLFLLHMQTYRSLSQLPLMNRGCFNKF